MIRNFLSLLFGTESGVNNIVNTVSNGIDKLSYTEQEKADAAAKERTEAREMLIRWASSTSGQNVARRFISVSLTMLWGVIYGVKVAMVTIAPFVDDESTRGAMMQSATALGSSAHELNGAMMLILTFYFAAPHVGKVVDPFIKKFGSKDDAR